MIIVQNQVLIYQLHQPHQKSAGKLNFTGKEGSSCTSSCTRRAIFVISSIMCRHGRRHVMVVLS